MIISVVGSNTSFVQEIEDIIWELDCSYLESLLEFSKRKGLDEEAVGSMVRKDSLLMARIAEEAETTPADPAIRRSLTTIILRIRKMLTDYQIEMLNDEQLNAKIKRLSRRWCRYQGGDPQKYNKFVELNKRLNKLESEYFKRETRKG